MTDQLADVLLHGKPAGLLSIVDDYARFELTESYIQQTNRPVLGLQFEDDLFASIKSNMRLPPWFSNLLPEGELRELIARQNGVSPKREAQLLLTIGHDLPGAVTIKLRQESEGHPVARTKRMQVLTPTHDTESPWTFSLAGVALKFSAIRKADRFTIPGRDERGGDWIIKLPDSKYEDVPQNEFAMMSLAAAVGIRVPAIQLVCRDSLPKISDHFWPKSQEMAFAVKRFDRDSQRIPIHMEDFAQIRGVWPEAKYDSSFETVAGICYRRTDRGALMEFVRRLIFNVLIGNGDAHLKNWTLLYEDERKPTLSPAYDLVSTLPYIADDNIGLKWRGKKRFADVTLHSLDVLAARLDALDLSLADLARDFVGKVNDEWTLRAEELVKSKSLRDAITDHMENQVRRLLKM